MADLLALSRRYIDEGIYEGPGSVNRVTSELSEVADGVAMIEAFSHVVILDSDDGLVLFDTSLESAAEGILKSLRGYSDKPVNTIAYTHGHIDHVGGTAALLDEARERRDPTPRVVGHENLPPRFARYQLTNGYNAVINRRQFGARGPLKDMGAGAMAPFGPSRWIAPDATFRDRLGLNVGGLRMELRHSKGETDDHLWAWLPERKAICTGDLMVWVFPNAGNPQKVQRYPLEWAAGLREMAALEPELLLPAHGLPIDGRERIARVLDDVASALESLVGQALDLMNRGAKLDDLIHGVKPPADLMEKPYLQPVYDEPEFVVRNIWRMYGGWYDGNPAQLKPAPARALAREMAALAGGARRLAERGRELAEGGDLRLACHLVELAAEAEPDSREIHGARAEVYDARRKQELSLMARGIYGAAASESREKA